jgi:hypothetical protein
VQIFGRAPFGWRATFRGRVLYSEHGTPVIVTGRVCSRRRAPFGWPGLKVLLKSRYTVSSPDGPQGVAGSECTHEGPVDCHQRNDQSGLQTQINCRYPVQSRMAIVL